VVCLQVKLCDPHLSALEVRFSRRGAIQIYVYLYVWSTTVISFRFRPCNVAEELQPSETDALSGWSASVQCDFLFHSCLYMVTVLDNIQGGPKSGTPGLFCLITL